jgi:hypothetical protein
MEDPDVDPCNYAYLIFYKVDKNNDGEKAASSTNFAWKSSYLPAEN